MQSVLNFFNEVGMLAHLPRSGFAFLGSGKQSVAEHSHRMTIIAYALARLSDQKIDFSKLLLMCLLHDFPEARTGDLNYVNKRYVTVDEEKIMKETKENLPFGDDIVTVLEEYNARQSSESLLAHDADQLELLLVLKELSDNGSLQAMSWYEGVESRLYTETAKKLAQELRSVASDAWWKV